MLKAVLLASCIIFIPGIAAAQVAVTDPEDRVSYTVGAATGYMIEPQAFLVEGPVVNAGLTYQANDNLSFDVWGQYGEHDEATEIDVTATLAETFGSIEVAVTGGAYLYPTGGSDTIYVGSVAASVPVGPVSLELSAERYEGGFDNTTYSVALSGSLNDSVDVTVGKAFNTGDINPWFVGASAPLGREELGIRVGVRTFWGADEGVVLEITRSY